MYTYVVYGLRIQSDLHLPELEPVTVEGVEITSRVQQPLDVIIRRGQVDCNCPELEETGGCIQQQEACFSWPDLGSFWVGNGNEIVVDARPGVQEQDLRLPLLGSMLAVLLHQRGLFVLHCSAVAIEGAVAVFLGNKGMGKSTLAASLYAQGHALVADDLVALDISDTSQPPLVNPGFPQFKLFPDSVVSSLGDDPLTLPCLATDYDKRSRRVDVRFTNEPLPLKRIYVLDTGDAVQIEPLLPQQALSKIISNSYSARFGSRLLRGDAASRHLIQCAQLIHSVPTRLLKRPFDLEGLSALANQVALDTTRHS
jgi:hypothetical protein